MINTKQFAYVDTYGCQLNESDSEKLRGMLIEMGYEITYDEFEADVAIVNTCAIRQNAENRVLGNVGELVHIKTPRKKKIIVFCGCLAGIPETVEKIRESYEHVNLVFPPNEIHRFPELLERAKTERKRVFIEDSKEYKIVEDIPKHRDSTIKAWLPIMYGCDNFCSYCIVPYVRGRERSRDKEAILAEAKSLVEAGYKDITLLGQNVNSWGGGFPNLLKDINAIPGEFLIRFMTSHPKDASKKLFQAMAESEKVARHIHLPFQSGSDRILKLMNRGYTRAEYLDKIAYARELMPELVITSDVIIGYPGETEEDYNDTLKLVEAAQFEAMFTFIYSKRPMTPAAKLNDTVSAEEKQKRFENLVTIQNEISEKKHEAYIGKTIRVLVDGEAKGELYPLKARTNGGRLVHVVGDLSIYGSFVDAKITHSNNWALFGEA
ncbi:MAG: tRNA (N6-isopentenyl adenosine(37)-C2)-methylthiotransferase MiaB [Oscillospiraceae bacterium]|jgi:tRNA-2-methylthio-N6-dimethylallyladenosine synthase|nr:tRNA (N6-isopentenyl adenosine(37)-C2)-methylthiotransferase MiaB [Oscillospiraceae bacterium]